MAKKKKTERKPGIQEWVTDGVSKISKALKHVQKDQPLDLVGAIKKDHDALREYGKILKDTDVPIQKRREAAKAFLDLLQSHTKSEEQFVYGAVADWSGRELQVKIAEGYVEHHVADQLMGELKRTRDAMTWTARANVLAEIVLHHLDEEESDLLPQIRKRISASADDSHLQSYLKSRAKTQKLKNLKHPGSLEAAGSAVRAR